MDGLVGRLFALVDLLQGRTKMTLTEISTHLGVSERTIRRDIAKLQSLDFQIEVAAGRNGGIWLESGSLFYALRFTDDEVLALSLGLELVRQSPNIIKSSVIDRASQRLASVMSKRLHQRLEAFHDAVDRSEETEANQKHKQSSSLILDLAEAIKQKRKTALSYRSSQEAITTRSINPYGMVYLKPYWYVAGYCHLREDIRTFRLDRIRHAEMLQEDFAKPLDFNILEVVSQAIAQSPIGSILCEIKLHTTMEEASRLIPPTAALLEPIEEGVLLHARCRPDQLTRVALHLLSLPFSLVVIKPQVLRDTLLEVSQRADSLAKIETS